MTANLIAELFVNTRRLTSAILILLGSVYIAGFVIVNAYLWTYGVAKVELFRPAFISAGVLFIIIGLTAGLWTTALMALFVALWLTAAARATQSYPPDERHRLEAILTRYLAADVQHRAMVGSIAKALFAFGCLIAAWVFFAAGYSVIIAVASRFTALLLDLATGTQLIAPESSLYRGLEVIVRLHGISAALIFLVVTYQRHLGTVPLALMRAFVALAFLFVQIYTLLAMADELYEDLPVSIGGGEPTRIEFLVERRHEPLLNNLGIGLTETRAGTNSEADILKTDPLLMIWQLNSGPVVDTTTDSLDTFVVRKPCIEEQGTVICQPAVEIRKSVIQSVIYQP